MKNENVKILICEDDPSINKLLSLTMEVEGYHYVAVQTGRAALRQIVSQLPDLLILDLGLPDMDGKDIIDKVRGFSQLPIIVVSARGEESDKIAALDAGADDYLTKPFSADELLARLRANLRRAKQHEQQGAYGSKTSAFSNGWLHIDFLANRVFVTDQEIHLTPIEYKLLCLLSENVDRVLTYRFIVKEIWGYYEEDFSALRVFVNTLRKKIELGSGYPKMIQTHIGIGYRLVKIEDGANK
ncbi:Transcriptional regulatory protein KdpE [Streptococcus canis]|uniref:Transcriptional regulatory protein KdpE n=1 Tax=Streptococcus canis TaxID=1329 RepID=A0A3P5YCG3_STRCB|nr:response regulator transcription factor [Streptococcus canis]MDV5973503.1 response regulator transcription factor [Streptococcus canis]QKG76863.1 response regulator transcription factor [Streptococcus canis]VDC43654.1 Transcriptional regulatory protein KdpE [Streptococcus canis]